VECLPYGRPEAVIGSPLYPKGSERARPTAHVGDFKVQTGKDVLRKRLRERRRSLSSRESARLGGVIARFAIALPDYARSRSIGVYHPIDHEVDPHPLVVHAVAVNKKVSLPVTDVGKGRMGFVAWRPEDPLVAGPFGTRQPRWSGDVRLLVAKGALDCIFLPMVGFDRQGWRLGYGGGYFDRYLAADTGENPCLVGLAYSFQEVETILAEPHDCRLHYVITERGVTRFPG